MKKNYVSLLICVLMVAVYDSLAQRSIGMPTAALVNSLMKEYHVPTVGIGIIEDGKIKAVRMFGNLAEHSPAPKNTLFNIASLTKPLTSTTVLKLVSQEKWKLDEPLYHYWIDPDVTTDERHKKLTTRHVLAHQTGLPNWRGHEPNGKLSFAFEPGTNWKYSGEGFEYLRQALEHKFQIPIAKLVDSILFEPLAMNDTRFYWDPTMDSSLYANRHREDGSPYPLETWSTANPSNLVLTTVRDYAKFGIEVINGMGVTPMLYNEMITNQTQLPGNKEWGLGWRLIKGLPLSDYALVHTGGNPGINTIVILLPKSKRGIVIFTNGAKGDQLFEKIVGEVLDVGDEILSRMK
jgi:CubicO group peptidase (beta-lactamase class C family)